jgi:hypothetical protein
VIASPHPLASRLFARFGDAPVAPRALRDGCALLFATMLLVDVANSEVEFYSTSRPHLAAAALLALAGLALFPAQARRAHERLTWLRFVPFVAVVLSMLAYPFDRVLGWGAPALFLVIALSRMRAIHAAWVALAFGVALRFGLFGSSPIDPNRSDMLPLTIRSIEAFLSGQCPYREYLFPWRVPLTYLPLTWLPYVPAHLAGIDVRWTNLVAQVAIMLAFQYSTARDPASRRDTPALWLASWVFLSPTSLYWDTMVTATMGWVAIAWVVALASRGSRLAPWALGAGLGATVLLVPLVPVLAIAWLADRGPRAAARDLAIAFVVGVAIVAPFAVACPAGFRLGIFLWFNDLHLYPAEWFEEHASRFLLTGFATVFWRAGIEGWLRPLQMVVTLLVALRFWRDREGDRSAKIPRYAAITMLVFILFNPIVWKYFLHPVLILGVIAIAALAARSDARPVDADAGARSEKL